MCPNQNTTNYNNNLQSQIYAISWKFQKNSNQMKLVVDELAPES